MPALSGRVAIVTGAARGIGLAIARRFLQEGARVALADIENAPAAAASLAGDGDVLGIPCDVTKAAEIEALMARTEAAFGALDLLVNNAGIVAPGNFLDFDEERFDRVMNINVKSVFLCSQAAARRMVARVEAGGPPGAIVNLASVTAILAAGTNIPYCASKAAVGQLTKGMAMALARYGIRVNAIGPGSIATDMLGGVLNPGLEQTLLSRTPLGRFGEPAEIAAVAVFLASAEASYITGQTIYADGGRLGLALTTDARL